MKKIRNLSLLIIGLLVFFMVAGVSPVQAQDERVSGAVWTSNENCVTQDKNQYARGEAIWLGGDGLDPSTTYHWQMYPAGAASDIVAEADVTSDSQGYFCIYAYTFVPEDTINNPYKVTLKTLAGGNVSNDNFSIEGTLYTNDVSVSVGACTWTVGAGSMRAVSLVITGGASVTIEKVGGGTWGPYTTSQIINLPEGDYTYWWVPTQGYDGSGEGEFTVAPCPPASASHEVLACEWTELGGSLTDVQIYVSNAELTLLGPGSVLVGVYTTDTVVQDLPVGTYTYTWHALPGYSGAGSGSFTLLECEPEKGDATVTVEACVWDEQEGSTFIAHIVVSNAALTIDGQTYTTTQDIKLPAGYYEYTWVAIEPYTGSGSGSIDVEGCEPATVDVLVGACDWIDLESQTPVTITIHGALLDLYKNDGGPVHIGQYGEGVSIVTLLPGSYFYTWVAVEDFTGSGDGAFDTLDCEPGKADAAITIGACTYTDGQSLTLVNITISNAILTIDGQTFTETAELKLLPGDYPYSWEAISEEFEGEGEGILSVGACEPKEEDPDVPAGGSGPSLIITLTPALLTVSGIAIGWMLIKHRIKKI